MRYRTVKRDSGLLNAYARERAAIDALEMAFQDQRQGARHAADKAQDDEAGDGASQAHRRRRGRAH